MQFRCEDLPDVGVRLIPHDSPNFARLLADITRHIESPPPGGPPPFPGEKTELPDPDDPASAILWNGSGKPICARTIIWNPGGSHITTPGFPSLLLPFGLPAERRAFETYWHTIMPDSKRWLASGKMLGSNADLRPPEGTEIWKGGVIRTGAGSGPRRGFDPDTVTLTIDAVFFASGECAGPDTKQLWDEVVSRAEVAQQIATTARKGVQAGLSADRVLAAVEQITGTAPGSLPAPPPPPGYRDAHDLREYARRSFASEIAAWRRTGGDEKTVATLSGWADAPIPQFRRI